ncbi:5'-3' exoribonuclease [Coniochaeta hoffmannii]|uniref:5'-3' exoribonuclease n=1 Tax=Coniochaeta hoffmannii TaxID=91930 RepID=A0AA38R2Q5_9PEZI|nr:5'-3' exoribonuclease [Coniochaeta hoffmannii]
MGIPAAFRWLSTKYPKIISPVIEEQPVVMDDGTVIPVDGTRPNPNGEEFDNLYLDMNGIVHPCSHPEDRPAPKDEEEMMVEIFKYTDRVVNMVRPRKLLMIAVDGVAPRAKMNQQRSRRFRAAQEAQEKEEDKQELLKLLKKQDGGVVARHESVEVVVKKAFDSNSITPGTPFMDILAASLRYWCAYKLNTDPAWAKMKVIISDATVPGEGEHKIMNFVRSQRSSPEHDPNTRHVIYGLDADLIMLGLATHEPHFRVLREDVFAQQANPRLCKLCGQKGHDARSCKGEAKVKEGEFDEKDHAHPLKPFIWLHVSVLREYLAVELNIPDLPFRFDLERAIDDWVFMCFFVGNDFLPHLPALEIRENGIDTLTAIWKDNLPYMGGYVTKDGHVDLERAQYIMNGLAKQEDAIFRRRKETEDRREANFKRRKLQEQGGNSRGGFNNAPRGQGRSRTRHPDYNAPSAADLNLIEVSSLNRFPSILKERKEPVTHDMVVNRGAVQQANLANKSAASVLKSQIQGNASPAVETKVSNGSAEGTADGTAPSPASATTSPASALGKRKAELMEDDESTTPGTSTPDSPTPAADAGEGPIDTVRLWEEGYADRYYEQKFHVDPKDIEFRHKVARAYVEGLAWVLMYYFQGCPSWEWYYPYHYAPFAADFVDLGKMTISFEKGRISRPFEQLMSVLPAASRHSLPEVFHDLMTNQDSEIIDFYPEEFEIDLNGKKMAWQGVALLPFIEMPRLLAAVEKKYPLLSADDTARNTVGKDVLLLSDAHEALYDEITINFYSKKQGPTKFKLNPAKSDGLAGTVEKIEGYIPHGSLVYPLKRNAMPDVEYDRSLSVHYEFPSSSHLNKSMLLRGVKMPPPVLDGTDIAMLKGKGQRSGRSYGGVPLEGGRNNYNNRGGGRGRPFNYGPGGNGYQGRDSYQPPPPSWQPPPPGVAGFGVGMPPPPPPAYVHGGAPPPGAPPGLDPRQQRHGGPQNGNGYNQRPYGGGGRGYQGSRDYR